MRSFGQELSPNTVASRTTKSGVNPRDIIKGFTSSSEKIRNYNDTDEFYVFNFPPGAMGLELEPCYNINNIKYGCKIKGYYFGDDHKGVSATLLQSNVFIGDSISCIDGKNVASLTFFNILDILKDLKSTNRKVTFKSNKYGSIKSLEYTGTGSGNIYSPNRLLFSSASSSSSMKKSKRASAFDIDVIEEGKLDANNGSMAPNEIVTTVTPSKARSPKRHETISTPLSNVSISKTLNNSVVKNAHYSALGQSEIFDTSVVPTISPRAIRNICKTVEKVNKLLSPVENNSPDIFNIKNSVAINTPYGNKSNNYIDVSPNFSDLNDSANEETISIACKIPTIPVVVPTFGRVISTVANGLLKVGAAVGTVVNGNNLNQIPNQHVEVINNKHILLNELSKSCVLLGIAEEKAQKLELELEDVRRQSSQGINNSNDITLNSQHLIRQNDELQVRLHEMESMYNSTVSEKSSIEAKFHNLLNELTIVKNDLTYAISASNDSKNEIEEWKKVYYEQKNRNNQLLDDINNLEQRNSNTQLLLEQARIDHQYEQDNWSNEVIKFQNDQLMLRQEMTNEFQNAGEQLYNIERERDSLLVNIEVLKDTIRSLESLNENDNKRFRDNINVQQISHQKHLEEKDLVIINHEKTISELKKEINELGFNNNANSSLVVTTTNELKQIYDKYEVAQERIQYLQKQLDLTKLSSIEEIGSLNMVKEEANDVILEMTSDIKRLEYELNQTKIDNNALKEALDIAKMEHVYRNNERETLLNNVELFANENGVLKNSLVELDNIVAKCNADNQSLTEQVNKLTMELCYSNTNNSNKDIELDNKNKDNLALSNTISDMNEELNQLKSDYNNIQVLNESIKNKNNVLIERIKFMEEEADGDKKHGEIICNQLEQSSKEMKKLSDDLVDAHTQIQSLLVDVNRINEEKDAMNELKNKEIEILNNTITSNKTDFFTALSLAQESQDQIRSELMEQLEKSKDTILKLQDTISHNDATYQQNLNEINNLEEMIDIQKCNSEREIKRLEKLLHELNQDQDINLLEINNLRKIIENKEQVESDNRLLLSKILLLETDIKVKEKIIDEANNELLMSSLRVTSQSHQVDPKLLVTIRHTMKSFKDSLASLRNDVLDMGAVQNSCKDECTHVTTKLISNIFEINLMRDELELKHNNDLYVIEDINRRHLHAIERAEAAENNCLIIEERCNTMLDKIHELEVLNDNLRHENHVLQDKIVEMNELEIKNEQNCVHESVISSLTNRIEELQEEKSSLSQDYESKISKLNNEYDTNLENLRADRARILLSYEAHADSLSKRSEEMMNNLRNDCDRLMSQTLSTHQEQLLSIQVSHDYQINEKNEEILLLKQQLEEFKDENEKLYRREYCLKESIDASEKLINEQKLLLNKLENKFTLYEDNNIDIEVKNEQIIQSLHQEIAEYKTKTQQQIDSLVDYRSKNQQQEIMLQEYSNKLHEQEVLLAEYKSKALQQENIIMEYSNKVQEQDNLLLVQNTNMTELTKAISNYESEVKAQRDSNKMSDDNNEKHMLNTILLQSNILKECEDREQENVAIRNKLEAFIQDLKNEHEIKTSNLMIVNEELVHEISNLKTSLHEKNVEYDLLSAQVNELLVNTYTPMKLNNNNVASSGHQITQPRVVLNELNLQVVPSSALIDDNVNGDQPFYASQLEDWHDQVILLVLELHDAIKTYSATQNWALVSEKIHSLYKNVILTPWSDFVINNNLDITQSDTLPQLSPLPLPSFNPLLQVLSVPLDGESDISNDSINQSNDVNNDENYYMAEPRLAALCPVGRLLADTLSPATPPPVISIHEISETSGIFASLESNIITSNVSNNSPNRISTVEDSDAVRLSTNFFDDSFVSSANEGNSFYVLSSDSETEN